jgi:uncharacterized membrane protein
MTQKTRTMTGLAILTAIIVVLTVIASFIKFGPFTITLALAPIIIGAALYGSKAGAYLGAIFGLVVWIACVLGWDVGGNILWTARPLLTCLLCLGKGAAAGLVSGALYRAVAPKNTMTASIVAGIACPVTNTGIFCIALALFYHETLLAWAGGTEVIYYVITGLVGINFVVELLINLVLSSVIVRVVGARQIAV